MGDWNVEDFKLNKLSMIALSLVSSIAWADAVILSSDVWLPFTGPSLENPGFMTELTHSIFTAGGYEVEYSIMPYKRSIFEAKNGNVDCIVGAAKSEVPGFYIPEEPFGVQSVAFFVATGNSWKFESIDSLTGLSLGVLKAYD